MDVALRLCDTRAAMRFVCPSCGSGYRIDDARVPEEGARFDCGNCSSRMVIKVGSDPVLVHSPVRTPVDDDYGQDLTASFTLIDLQASDAEPVQESVVWHVTDQSGAQNSMTETELNDALADGRLTGESLIWRPGLESWTTVSRDPIASELLKKSGPWHSGSITSIFEAARVDPQGRDRSSVSPIDAPAAIERMVQQPTLPPNALPRDVRVELEDRLGEQPEVVIAHEGMLRRGHAASPVAVAVRRNQRRLLMMALGVPLLIVLTWRVVTWPRGEQNVVSEAREARTKRMAPKGETQQEQERQRRQRLLLKKGSFRLTSDQKAAVLERELGPLKACGFGQSGDALVRFRIKPNGAAFDIRVAGITGAAAQCIRQTVSRWRFPRFTGPADEMSFPLPRD